MAKTSNSRDVELRISAQTSGNEQIRELANQVEALAKKGGDAAPEFKKLAEELDKIATQDAAIKQLGELETQIDSTSSKLAEARTRVRELGDAYNQQKTSTDAFRSAQAQARDEVEKTEDKLRAARASLTTFRAESDQSARATNEYKTRLGELRKAVADLQNELEKNKALAGTKSDLRELEVETRRAEKAFQAAEKEVAKLSGTLTAQTAKSDAVRQSLGTLGVETTELATAQKNLSGALIATTSAFAGAAEAQRVYESVSKAVAESNERAVAAAKASAAARTRAQAEIAAAEREAASASEAAALRTKLAQESIAKAVAESNQRAVAAARAAAEARQKLAADTTTAERNAAAATEAAALRIKLAQDEVAAKARVAGQALEAAFSTLNVRSADAIRAEIDAVRNSLALLANSGQLSAGQLKTAFEQAQSRINGLSRELSGIPEAVSKSNAAFAVLRQSLSQLTAAFGVFEASRAFIDAVNNVETLRRSLTLLLGDSKAAEKQIQFLRDAANTAGLSVGTLSKDFVNFTAALQTSGISLERQRDVFAAVTNAAGQLGISTDRVGLILQAFAQTANKGKVTLEELQGQLGESLPGALDIVSKGLGVTKDRLLELVKSGIDADTFFAAFIRGSKQAFGDGTQQVESFSAAWNRLKNAFNEFSTRAADTSVFKLLVGAIDSLAANFNTVATAATIAAQAFALFKFTEYIRGFTGIAGASAAAKTAQDAQTASTVTGTAAKAADTGVTNVNTAAVQANTAAQVANKAAWAALAADIGKLGPVKAETAKQAGVMGTAMTAAAVAVGTLSTAARGLLGLVGGLPGALALVALNADTLGKAIASQVADWTGLKKQIEDNERQLKQYDEQLALDAKAQRDAADAVKLAKFQMQGLSDETIKLIGLFDDKLKKTGSLSEAYETLSKNIRFDDLSGIRAAADAVVSLGEQGKITGDKMKAIFAEAAQGKDLLLFETNVRAALGGMRNEAATLKSAIEAIAEESLKRVGSSVKELQTGYTSAFITAVNNTDQLQNALKTLGATSSQTSELLTRALTKEAEASTTSKAISEVIARINSLASSGKIADTDLKTLFTNSIAKALEFAKTESEIRKVEEALRGIINANPQLAQSFDRATNDIKAKLAQVNPALKRLQDDAELLGVKIGASSTEGVNKAILAYERLKASGTLSTGGLQEAFVNLARTVIESSNGSIPEWLKVEAAIREVDLSTITLSRNTSTYANNAVNDLSRVESKYRDVSRAAKDAERDSKNAGSDVDKFGFKTDKSGNRITAVSDTFLSAYNFLKQGGASEEQARQIASRYFPNPGQGVAMQPIREANARAGIGGFGNLSTALAQELSDLVRGGRLGEKGANEESAQRAKDEAASLRERIDTLEREALQKNDTATANSLRNLSGQVAQLGTIQLKAGDGRVSDYGLARFNREFSAVNNQFKTLETKIQTSSKAADSLSARYKSALETGRVSEANGLLNQIRNISPRDADSLQSSVKNPFTELKGARDDLLNTARSLETQALQKNRQGDANTLATIYNQIERRLESLDRLESQGGGSESTIRSLKLEIQNFTSQLETIERRFQTAQRDGSYVSAIGNNAASNRTSVTGTSSYSTVTINFNGVSRQIKTSSKEDADALTKLLSDLAAAAGRTGP